MSASVMVVRPVWLASYSTQEARAPRSYEVFSTEVNATLCRVVLPPERLLLPIEDPHLIAWQYPSVQIRNLTEVSDARDR